MDKGRDDDDDDGDDDEEAQVLLFNFLRISKQERKSVCPR